MQFLSLEHQGITTVRVVALTFLMCQLFAVFHPFVPVIGRANTIGSVFAKLLVTPLSGKEEFLRRSLIPGRMVEVEVVVGFWAT